MPDAYCVDIGQAADGRILPIEINGMPFVGIYAVDYARVAAAYARRIRKPVGESVERPGLDDIYLAETPDLPRIDEATKRDLVEGFVAARFRGEDIAGCAGSPTCTPTRS